MRPAIVRLTVKTAATAGCLSSPWRRRSPPLVVRDWHSPSAGRPGRPYHPHDNVEVGRDLALHIRRRGAAGVRIGIGIAPPALHDSSMRRLVNCPPWRTPQRRRSRRSCFHTHSSWTIPGPVQVGVRHRGCQLPHALPIARRAQNLAQSPGQTSASSTSHGILPRRTLLRIPLLFLCSLN